MKMLSTILSLKRYLAERYRNNIFLDSAMVSDSELQTRETGKIEVAQNSAELETPARWSPAMQSLLEEPPSNLPLRLIVGAIVFFLSFTIWAWFGEVEKIGKAQGKLVPKGETYKIESLDSAKVSQIDVKEGEEVKAGQLIAQLDSEREQREVNSLTQMLLAYRSQSDQKRQLLKKAKVERKTQNSIAQAEIQTQESAIASAQEQAKVTSQLLVQQESELAAYTTRQKQVRDLTGIEQEKLAQINSELNEHQKRVDRLKPLLEQGAISQESYFQATQAQRQAKQQLIDSKLQNISNISEQIFQSEQSLREMATRITQSQGELTSTRKEIERLQAELAHKKAERLRSQLETEQKIQQLKLEINQTNAKITETQNQLANAQSELDQRFLRSPVAGTVLAFNVTNTGKVVQAGETIAEIAPHGSPLVLSAMLRDRDAGFVEREMPAQVKFDAYSYQDYGVTPGKVISISSDTKTDEKLGAVYEVKIALDRNYITSDLKKVSFKPGQTASADIVIRRRRVIDVLLDPIKKLEQDGIDM